MRPVWWVVWRALCAAAKIHSTCVNIDAPYIGGMNNIDEKYLSRESFNPDREFVNYVRVPEGGEIVSFRTDSGFEHEFWRPGNVYLLARWWTNKGGTPIASITQPSSVSWDYEERLTEVCFSPTEEQIVEHFSESTDPLVVRYSRTGDELRRATHFEKDELSGRILRVYTGYFATGAVRNVETYYCSELLSYLEYDESGNLIVEH